MRGEKKNKRKAEAGGQEKTCNETQQLKERTKKETLFQNPPTKKATGETAEHTGISTKLWKVVPGQWDTKGRRSSCRRRRSRSWSCLTPWLTDGAQTKPAHLSNNLRGRERPGTEEQKWKPAGGWGAGSIWKHRWRRSFSGRDEWDTKRHVREKSERETRDWQMGDGGARLTEGSLGSTDLHGEWFIGLNTTGMAVDR